MKIKELLMKLNFNIGTKGFEYWIYAINENINNKKDIMEIYNELSNKENVSWQQIQNAMEYTRKLSDDIIKLYFNYSGKITNKIILNLISLNWK